MAETLKLSHWKKKATVFSLAGKGSIIYKSGRQSPKIGYVGPEAYDISDWIETDNYQPTTRPNNAYATKLTGSYVDLKVTSSRFGTYAPPRNAYATKQAIAYTTVSGT